jgi:hypothetical protein
MPSLDSFIYRVVPDRAAHSGVRDRCFRVSNLGGTIPPAYRTKVSALPLSLGADG